MSRQQLPPQIKRLEVLDRKTGKPVVRYQVTVDAGTDPIAGQRRQVRRRFNTERVARDELGKITNQATGRAVLARSAASALEPGALAVSRLGPRELPRSMQTLLQ